MKESRGLLPSYGIEPLSSLIRERYRLPTLVVATLLDCGRAMSLESIAEHLIEAGFGEGRKSVDQVVRAIRDSSRSRRYLEPMATHLAPDGKLALVLQGHALRSFVFHLTWKPSPPPVRVLPADSEPLRTAELEEFFAEHAFGTSLSVAASVAALVDANSSPLDERDIVKLLRAAGVKRACIDERLDATNLVRSRLLIRDAEGRIGLRNGADIERFAGESASGCVSPWHDKTMSRIRLFGGNCSTKQNASESLESI